MEVQEEYGYSVTKIAIEDLPDGVDADHFHTGVWMVKLNGEPQAFCASEQFAKAIVQHNLARATIKGNNVPWFKFSQNSCVLAVCRGATRDLADKYFNGGLR